MTSVMLAAYSEVFAGGAVIAGVPYRGGSVSRLPSAACSRVKCGPRGTGAIWCERRRRTRAHGPSCRSGMAAPI